MRIAVCFCISIAVAQIATSVGAAKLPAKATTRPTSVRAPLEPTARLRAERLPERPSLTGEQAARRAAELRQAYAKPPAEWPPATVDPGVEFAEIGLLPPVRYPDDNPYSKEKDELGRTLFFDPRLSGSGQIACASCHDPDLAWADGRTTPFGHDRTNLKRNAPSVLLSAYARPLFWDGRAKDLEDQFHSPVVAHEEMNGDIEAVEKRLGAIPEYRAMFKAAFGIEETGTDAAAKAVATFERSIAKVAGRSDFDKFLKGEQKRLSDSAVRGLHVFRTVGRCMNCHSGPALTDNQFHDLGLSYYGRKYQDLGRYVVTRDPKDVGRFRTPTLRDVARTNPYMHNGLFELDGVIAAYNAGMATLTPRGGQVNDPLFPKKDPLLKPLGLNGQDRDDLKAFLESLSEPKLRVRAPTLPGMAAGPAAPAGAGASTGTE
jgi:cytochrome c peroxidase